MSSDAVLRILRQGTLAIQGEFLWGSNYTFLVQVQHGGAALQAVYKPTRGVRPLWDFPAPSLARREVAAYLLSEALGWRLVPPTVYRTTGPLGPASLQLFIEHDPEYHYFSFSQADRQRLRPVALFDLLVNNADRKASHIILGPDKHLWLIDHGICFHAENKLRTVVWDFAGEPLPEELCADIAALRAKLGSPEAMDSGVVSSLQPYLNQREITGVAHRAGRLLASGRFPHPDPRHQPYPWPPV